MWAAVSVRGTLSDMGDATATLALEAVEIQPLAEAAAADVRNRASGVVRVGAPLVLASAVYVQTRALERASEKLFTMRLPALEAV